MIKGITYFDLTFYFNNYSTIHKIFESMQKTVQTLEKKESFLSDRERRAYEKKLFELYRFEKRLRLVMKTFLSENERRAINMRFFKKMSLAEISAKLRKSTDDVVELMNSAFENIVENYTQT